MKRCVILFLLLPFLLTDARADHITGGEMFYSFAGITNGMYQYNVTLKLFMRCNSGRQFPNPNIISVFDRITHDRISDIQVALSRQEQISINSNNPCISNPPVVCYDVGYYNFTVSLPATANGYLLSSQVNYRIAGISNLSPGYGLIGATYTAEIPGTSAGNSAPANNSAAFTGSDLVIVCAENSMTYGFGATDADGDQLQYSFCEAYQSGTSGQGAPPPPPPYQSVPYGAGFNGASPLGPNVRINEQTGMIKGIAPTAGIYVVTVCVSEIRHGLVIATQRKDLQINIASCTIAAASLLPAYMLCGQTRTLNISNLSISPLIKTYFWEFTNAKDASIFTSTNPNTSFTFPDTGLYRIKLVINRNEQCSDSITSVAKVYPGFKPSFNYSGICFTKPTAFKDATTSVYGSANAWSWNFGEGNGNDRSNLQDPIYTYPTAGTKKVQLIVNNSKGCVDTVIKTISIVDRPPLTLAFRDTLICIPDAVQLRAEGEGIFNWTPVDHLENAGTPAPIASPQVNTTYFVELNDNGCRNKDSVNVRVTDHVSINAMRDTIICQDDPIVLRISSDGFQYSWSPAQQLNDPHAQNPIAFTHLTTKYEVTARIGSCTAKDQINVSTVPYPTVNAGADTLICFGYPVQLNAFTDGTSFMWSPENSLSNPTVLDPIAHPRFTTTYVLSAYDTKGCPKPGKDSIVVTVLPPISPSAGNDTSVVIGQPLQLKASGGVRYEWRPVLGLSSAMLPNPVALFNAETFFVQYTVYVYNQAGCVDSATVKVKVFHTGPNVFVPNAFSPNGDGHNDVLRPLAAGIKQLEYFNVYSRWGQLMFSSTKVGFGWDGRLGGHLQPAGSYVWILKAIDYNGVPIYLKGMVMLVH